MSITKSDLLSYLLAVVLGSVLYNIVQAANVWRKEVDKIVNMYSPVVIDTEIVQAQRTMDSMYIRVVGTKVRECGPPLAIFGQYAGGFRFESIVFINDLNADDVLEQPTVRHTGKQDFGWWRLKPSPPGTQILIYVLHDCPDAGLVRTKMGPFDVTKVLDR